MSDEFINDVVVIGGGGHVGLPLAIALADRGSKVVVYDVSEKAVATINSGKVPFTEPGAEPVLQQAIANGQFAASSDPAVVATARNVIVVIGTPVDEHLTPTPMPYPRRLRAAAATSGTDSFSY